MTVSTSLSTRDMLTQAYQDKRHYLSAIAYNAVSDTQIAEDIVQRAFLRLLRKIEKSPDYFDSRMGGILPLLVWNVKNISIDYNRFRNSKTELINHSSVEGYALSDLPRSAFSGDLLDQEERCNAIFECVDRLPVHIRSAMIAASKGAKSREYAQDEKIDPTIGSSRFCRGRKRLRELLEK